MGSRVTRVMGFLHANYGLPTPFRSYTGQTDRRTDRKTTAINALSASLYGPDEAQ